MADKNEPVSFTRKKMQGARKQSGIRLQQFVHKMPDVGGGCIRIRRVADKPRKRGESRV
jgi:hypothetical protein